MQLLLLYVCIYSLLANKVSLQLGTIFSSVILNAKWSVTCYLAHYLGKMGV